MSEERTALITGGGSGIGAATAERFGRAGVRVAILGRDESKLVSTAEAVRKESGAAPLVVPADQKDDTAVKEAVARVVKEFGRIDILVNNAAVYELGGAADSSMEHWDRIMDINFRGALLVTREVLACQREQGSGVIVNVASTLGFRTIPGVAAYACSKSALLMLTQCLALEEAQHGIRIVAVCPGFVDTPIHTVQGEERDRLLERMAELHPLNRVGTSDEVAAMIEYLSNDDARWMTGSVVTIDGGISLR